MDGGQLRRGGRGGCGDRPQQRPAPLVLGDHGHELLGQPFGHSPQRPAQVEGIRRELGGIGDAGRVSHSLAERILHRPPEVAQLLVGDLGSHGPMPPLPPDASACRGDYG